MIFVNHFSKRVVPREYKQKLQKKIPPRKDSLSFRGFFVLFRKYCIRLKGESSECNRAEALTDGICILQKGRECTAYSIRQSANVGANVRQMHT